MEEPCPLTPTLCDKMPGDVGKVWQLLVGFDRVNRVDGLVVIHHGDVVVVVVRHGGGGGRRS